VCKKLKLSLSLIMQCTMKADRYNSTHYWPQHWIEVSGEIHDPADLLPRKEPSVLGYEYKADDYWLLIDSWKLCLNAVHCGNDLPPIPDGHSVHKKEPHETRKIVLICVQYNKYFCNTFGGLKLTALLHGSSVLRKFASSCDAEEAVTVPWENGRFLPDKRTLQMTHL
jgi:hypothetical protein